jgi:hypothetical protein
MTIWLSLLAVILPNSALVSAAYDFQRTVELECTITRFDGSKEPGMTNIQGQCCSSIYADNCVSEADGPAAAEDPPLPTPKPTRRK